MPKKPTTNGSGRPKVDLDDAFLKIQPYLQLGYSFHKSCLHAEYPYSTIIPYYNDDEGFRNKVERERTLLNVVARRNISNAINKDKNLDASRDWLERMESDEFTKVHKVEDVTPQDEGVLLLRAIILERRLYVKKQKKIASKAKGEKDKRT
jgi:hypothetical protein